LGRPTMPNFIGKNPLSVCSFPHYIRSRWKKQARRANSNSRLRSGGVFWPSGHFCRGKRRAPLAFPTGSV
jgi:hypothetical protein